MPDHQRSSLMIDQPNYYPGDHLARINCVLTRKMICFGIELTWNYPFQFSPVNLEFPMVPTVICMFDIALYYVLFFLMFLYTTYIFKLKWRITNFFHITLYYYIYQKELTLLFEVFRRWCRIFCGDYLKTFSHIWLIIKEMQIISGL